MDSNNVIESYPDSQKQNEFNPREFIVKYLHYLPWIFVSLSLFLATAYLKLRYSKEYYNASGKLIIKKDVTTTRGGDKFDDIFMMQAGNQNLNDEIQLIKSTSISKRVVRDLNLETSYLNQGKIRSALINNKEAPFILEILKLNDSSRSFSFSINILNEREYSFSESGKPFLFGQVFQRPEGVFRLVRANVDLRSFASKLYLISWLPSDKVASSLANELKVAQATDYSNVLNLSFESENPRMAANIVNSFMDAYQKSSLEDKRLAAVSTLNFIDSQLDTVRFDLGLVERNLQKYREKNKLFNVEQQSLLSFNSIGETDKELTELQVKIKVVDYLITYVQDRQNPYRMVPTTLGIAEPSLLQSLTEYNKFQLQRETYLKSMPPSNPLIRDLETAIEKLRSDILENLLNVRKAYQVTISDLTFKNERSNAELSTIPSKQKEGLEITRRQKILEELFSFLLQKKLETSIGSASTISNIKVVEPAQYSSVPVRPDRKGTYTIAVFLGLMLPAAVIFLIEYLNDKVSSRRDIEKITATPILGEIGHSDDKEALIVKRNNRKFIAEQFRMIRTNLQYILPKDRKPILLVTSSYSGEGKSFISTNLGSVMALSGKRTVILEFDIRKPKIMKGLGLTERKGITNYIIGNLEFEDIIYPAADTENLFVIPCGPVPPNPAEMLLDPKISELFSKLLENFDVVIIDTAPVGLVSDAITLSRFASATVYIVRHGYTLKKQVKLIEELYKSKKLPNLSIVINDIKAVGGYGGYYGYGNYGYGYGYGYGVNGDYFEDGKGKKPKLWKRVRSFFG